MTSDSTQVHSSDQVTAEAVDSAVAPKGRSASSETGKRKGSAKAAKSVEARRHEDGASAESAEAGVDAMRSVAEKSLDQVRSAFNRSQEASLYWARGLEASGQVVQSGLKEIQARFADALEAEAHAAFGYIRAFTQVRSVSEIIDLQSTQLRKQFERGFDEARELSSLATAVATKATEPVLKAFTHALDV